MKFKSLIATAAIFAFGISMQAQTNNKALSIHNKIHSEQLANAKSRIDKSVLSDIIKEDFSRKENSEIKLSDESSQMVTDLLGEANRYLGRPYRHGAKGPKAFDCSGFTSYVYRQFGFELSPSSRAQFGQGVKVEKNDLKQGDLVFFTSRRSGNNVGHVGIVVSADNASGNFKFIHASMKGITVSDYKGYYLGRYLGARRIITE